MLTAKQLDIFSIFARQPLLAQSFSTLKARSGAQSHSVIQQAIKAFKEEQLINERKIGSTKLFSLNFKESSTCNYIELATRDLLKARTQELNILQEHMQESFHAILVFGSYAAQTQNAKSDFDVAIIIPENANKNSTESALRSASNKTIIALHSQVITEKEFLEMLAADYENLAKEIARNHLAVHGSSAFYNLLQHARAHGWDHEAILRTG